MTMTVPEPGRGKVSSTSNIDRIAITSIVAFVFAMVGAFLAVGIWGQKDPPRGVTTTAAPVELVRYRDDARGVTCWRVAGHDGIACIADPQPTPSCSGAPQ